MYAFVVSLVRSLGLLASFTSSACTIAHATARDASAPVRTSTAIGMRALEATPGVCDPTPSLARLGAGCHRIAPSNVRASGNDPNGVGAAVDANVCTLWNAGAVAPQSIEFDVPPDAEIAGIFVTPEMTPSGTTTHVIEIQRANGTFEALHVVRGEMTTQVPSAMIFVRSVRATRLRLRTLESPSWVAWREVFPFVCDGALAASPVVETAADAASAEPTLTAALRVVHGRGACRTDADCVPDRCCQPDNCSARASAPHCQGTLCPMMLGPMAFAGTGCLCVRGTCGARIQESVGLGGI